MKEEEIRSNSDRPTWGDLIKGILAFGKKGEAAEVDDNYIDFNDGSVDMDVLTKAWNNVDTRAEQYTVISKEEHTKKSNQPREDMNSQKHATVNRDVKKQQEHGEIGE